jgi:hypothetical protein
VDFGEQGPAEDKSVLDIYSAAYTHHWGHFQNGCQTVSGVTTCDTYPEARAKLDAQRSMSCGATTSLEDENCRAQKASATGVAFLGKGHERPHPYDLSDTDATSAAPDPGLTLGTAPSGSTPCRQHQMQRAVDYVERAQVDRARGARWRSTWTRPSGIARRLGRRGRLRRSHWAALSAAGHAHVQLSQRPRRAPVVLRQLPQLRQASQWAAANGLFLVIDTNGKEQTPGGNLGTDMADWLLMENSLRDSTCASRRR